MILSSPVYEMQRKHTRQSIIQEVCNRDTSSKYNTQLRPVTDSLYKEDMK